MNYYLRQFLCNLAFARYFYGSVSFCPAIITTRKAYRRSPQLSAVYQARGQRVLGFGPGDGWPSLIIAPQVASVTGVDASPRRVQGCTGNAARLGLGNTRFVVVPPEMDPMITAVK